MAVSTINGHSEEFKCKMCKHNYGMEFMSHIGSICNGCNRVYEKAIEVVNDFDAMLEGLE